MKKLAVVVACLAFAAPASAQSIGEKTGLSALIGIAPTTTDFISQAAIGDMFGVEVGKLALARGGEKSKRFAEQSVQDHEVSAQALRALIAGGNVRATIPTAIDSSRRAVLDKLAKLQGDEFDNEYFEAQASAQADALSLYQRYSRGGDHRDLKLYAVKRLPGLEESARLAKDLKN